MYKEITLLNSSANILKFPHICISFENKEFYDIVNDKARVDYEKKKSELQI